MDINTLITTYEQHSKADIYRIGFTYRGNVYYIDITHIPTKWVRYCKETESHKAKLQLRLKDKKHLVYSGLAIRLMTVKEWEKIKGYNNGVKFEGYMWRKYKHTYKKDSKPFYEDSDIKIDGIGYQLKWQNGHLVNIETLSRLG